MSPQNMYSAAHCCTLLRSEANAAYCGTSQQIETFSTDGAKKESEKFNIPFLGSLPIDKDLRIQSDEGRPSCIDNPEGFIANTYIEIAKKINQIVI